MSKQIEHGTNVETTTDAAGNVTTVENKYERVVEMVARKAAYVSIPSHREMIAGARDLRRIAQREGGELGRMVQEAREAMEEVINAEDRIRVVASMAGCRTRKREAIGGEAMIEKDKDNVFVTSGLPTKQVDINDYMRQLGIAKGKVDAQVQRVIEWAKNLGIRVMVRPMEVIPEELIVGRVVQFARVIERDEYERL
jgi:hypothetical protein